jgi:excisionase family DNA binding protein
MPSQLSPPKPIFRQLLPQPDQGVIFDDLLLTPEEAGRALRVGRNKVYELIASGELRSVKLGRCRRIPVDALRQFVANLQDAA